MFIVAFITVLTVLLCKGTMQWYGYLVCSMITSLVVSVVELYTPNGLDTVTCPLASMLVIVPLLLLFGGLVL